MEYVLLAIGVFVFLVSLVIQTVMTISYQREVKWLNTMIDLSVNASAFEDSLFRNQKRYRLTTAFLVSSMVFGLSAAIVVYLYQFGDFTCKVTEVLYYVFLILELLSIIISTVLITIIQYKRSRFE